MDLGFDVVVTVTGIVLVFLILVLLMAIITLEGKIFFRSGQEEGCRKACCPGAAGRCSGSPGGGRHSRRCGCRDYGSHPRHGQWQVHPQGGAPRHQRLGQGRCERHHGPVLTQEEEHDTVY